MTTTIKKTIMGCVAILATGAMAFSVLSAKSYSASAETIEETTTGITLNDSDINLEDGGSTVYLDATSAIATASDSNSFTGNGSGTYENPYIVMNVTDFLSIGNLSNTMITTYLYFELGANIDLTSEAAEKYFESSSYVTTYFHGELSGSQNSYIITAPTAGAWFANYSVGKADFKNITIDHGNNGYFGLLQLSGYYVTNAAYNEGVYDNIVTFDSVYSKGSYTAINNVSAYACLVWGTCYFNGCTSNATINITGYSGVFVGGYPYSAKISFIGCSNKGTVSGAYIGFFNGNSPSLIQAFEVVDEFKDIGSYSQAIVSDCTNAYMMYGTYTCTPFSTNYNAYNDDANKAVLASGFTKGYMESGNVLSSVEIGLNEAGNVVYSGYSGSGTYTVSIFVSISCFASESKETSYGSSYVMITETFEESAISAVSAIYATRIVSSTVWNSEVTSDELKYENLVNDTNRKTDNYGGHEYILYNNTIIVSSASLVTVAQEQNGAGVGYVTCDSVPTYRLNYYNTVLNLATGTAEFSASDIK